MSLDITFTSYKPLLCPHCGEVVKREVVNVADSDGRAWYPFLESVGYYTPGYRSVDDETWYGKDMELTEGQLKELYKFMIDNEIDLYSGHSVRLLVMAALLEGETVVVNVDW